MLVIGASVAVEMHFTERIGVLVMAFIQTGNGVGGGLYPYVIDYFL